MVVLCRQMLASLGRVEPKIQHINAFVVMKIDHFLYSLQCWDKVFVIEPAQKLFI